MKSEKLYELAMLIYSQLDPYEKDNADSVLNGKYAGYTTDGKTKNLTPYDVAYEPLTMWTNLGANVGELIRVIKNEMTAEETKKAGKADQSKTIKAVLKTSETRNRETVPALCTTYIANGKQYVTDGYRVFKFVNPTKDVPFSETIDPNYDIPRVCENHLALRNYTNSLPKLNTPDLAKLKAYVKRKAVENKLAGMKNYKAVKYCFGSIIVDARFLVDLLEFMPEAEIYWQDKPNLPIYACDAEGNEAMIWPINPNDVEILTETEL